MNNDNLKQLATRTGLDAEQLTKLVMAIKEVSKDPAIGTLITADLEAWKLERRRIRRQKSLTISVLLPAGLVGLLLWNKGKEGITIESGGRSPTHVTVETARGLQTVPTSQGQPGHSQSDITPSKQGSSNGRDVSVQPQQPPQERQLSQQPPQQQQLPSQQPPPQKAPQRTEDVRSRSSKVALALPGQELSRESFRRAYQLDNGALLAVITQVLDSGLCKGQAFPNFQQAASSNLVQFCDLAELGLEIQKRTPGEETLFDLWQQEQDSPGSGIEIISATLL